MKIKTDLKAGIYVSLTLSGGGENVGPTPNVAPVPNTAPVPNVTPVPNP